MLWASKPESFHRKRKTAEKECWAKLIPTISFLQQKYNLTFKLNETWLDVILVKFTEALTEMKALKPESKLILRIHFVKETAGTRKIYYNGFSLFLMKTSRKSWNLIYTIQKSLRFEAKLFIYAQVALKIILDIVHEVWLFSQSNLIAVEMML